MRRGGRMTNLPDFKECGEAACCKLWGEPDQRTKKELRWNGGDAYSARTYNIRKRVWYDRGKKFGGSTLHLVDYTKGRPKRELRGAVFYEVWGEANAMGIVPDPAPALKANWKGGGFPPILATYPYRNAIGELLFEVVRFDDPENRFKQRRPDGEGGWIWDLKGVPRVLYRLPELIAAVKAGEWVIVTEGERDAENAVWLGYVATTMPGGVGKWLPQYDDHFAGAPDVIVVSDNDPQSTDPKTGQLQFHPDGRPVLKGQDHAAKIAHRLSKIAGRVRVVMFEQAKDLSAWVEAGGTREQLDALIEQAPNALERPRDEADEEAKRAEAEAAAKAAAEAKAERSQLLAELNAENCVVLDGARTMVLRFEEIEHSAGGESYIYRVPTFLRFYDFLNPYLNRFVDTGAKKPPSLGQWWLTHRRRRQYRGVIFRPAGPPIIKGRLNLWTGWGVEPKEGDWSLLRRHIREVLADFNEAVYQYIINWIAWSVQNPGQQAEVALVFIGDRGIGKGTLGKALCKIFGKQHSLHLSSPEHLTGRFNAHLRQCCF